MGMGISKKIHPLPVSTSGLNITLVSWWFLKNGVVVVECWPIWSADLLDMGYQVAWIYLPERSRQFLQGGGGTLVSTEWILPNIGEKLRS